MNDEQENRQLKLGMILGRFWGDFGGACWPYLLVLMFGLILTMGVWALGLKVMTGDDYAFHTMRMQSASKAWSNGQLVPQVDPDALSGFGYAYNLFYGPLITYVTAGLQALWGFWPLAMNVALVLCLVGTGLTMCHTMLKISKNRALSVMVAVFYMAAPYVLNNLYSRMALGEVVSTVAAPILLLGLYQLIAQEKHAARNIAISAAILVLTHNLSAVLFGIFGVVFVLLNLKRVINVRSIWRMILGGVVALGLTAFFTLPMLEAKMEGNYGVFDAGYSEKYFGANAQSVNDHRLWPQQLFGIDYTSRTNAEGLSGEFGVTLGVMAMVGLFGFLFIRKDIEDEVEQQWVTSIYVISILAILISLPILDWKYMPDLLLKVQFPWRFLMIAALGLSVAGGYTVFTLVRGATREKQAAVMVMAGVLAIYFVMPTILPNPGQYLENVEEVEKDPVTLGWQAEYLPMQLLCSPDDEEDLKQGYACGIHRSRELLAERGDGVEVVNGELKDLEVWRDGLNFELEVENGDGVAELELPVVWYPGYKARLNGEDLAVRASDRYGLVLVSVPAGAEGEIEVWYGVSKATKIGAVISGVTAGLGVVWVTISGIYDAVTRKKKREMANLMDSVREAVEANEAEEQLMAEVEKMAAQSESEMMEEEAETGVDDVEPVTSGVLGLPMPPEAREAEAVPTQEKPKRGRRKVAKADVEKLQSGDVAGTTRKKNTTTRTTKGSRATSVKKAGSASDGATEVGVAKTRSGAKAATRKTATARVDSVRTAATKTRTTRVRTTKIITKEPE